ncbi:MAG TPA: helix-turn-helix domain-containing protein, partial [Roseiflexaceae bacterium]
MSYSAAISPAAFFTFGDLLRYLRRRARLQQRDLAIAVGYSESQICRLEQNQRLPDLTILLARFIPALALTDEPELTARLIELAAVARGECPDEPNPAAAQPLWSRIAVDLAGPEPGNLPAPITPLINRTKEIAVIRGCLGRADVRLLTLVGPPGIGKTRLSIHVAASLQSQFADGVFFVPLAPIRDPALVLPAIARALRVKDVSDQPPTEALRAALRGRRLLLVLDNFEQLMAATSQVAEVLRMAPDLKVLITSRAALHLTGEHLFAVPPLELPDLDAQPPLDELARWPAVELFTTRVCAIKPDFALTADNARTVVEICACLDGLPLAIELAAARSRLFTAQALLDRLRGASGPTTLQFLVDGPRDLLAHQQTLRSTIDWSYDLLDAGERQLLMRLAVFIGGVALEAATAVMSSDLHNSELIAQNSELDILDGLTSLVDKSLLNYETGADGEPRFTMLETIREYAREKL